jgi:murein DD-endopeptidase MepM/ murein hydrolase activator NlpD
MATIDSKKLLPSSTKGSAIDKPKFLVPIKNISTKKISGSDLKPIDKKTETSGSLVVLKKKIIKLDSLIQNNLLIDQKERTRKRKEEERSKVEKREADLEKGVKKNNVRINLISSIPGQSILDKINRFIGFTLLGYLFNKYGELLPKLMEFGKVLKPVAEFVESFAKNLLKGVIDFVEFGYKAYDKTRDFVKQIGGEGAQKTFDEFSKQLNLLLNGAIAASMLIASSKPKPTSTGSGSFGAGYASGYAAGLSASRGGRPGAGFRDPSRYRSPGQARSGGFDLEQTRRINTQANSAAPTGPKGPLDRISRGIRGAGAQLETGTLFKRGAGLQKSLYNAPGKIKSISSKFGEFGGKIFGRIPIIGGLINFAISLALGEDPGRAAAKAVGSTAGAALGTFIPVPGVGTILGGILGDIAGGALYDTLIGNKQKPQGRAEGGQVTRGGQSTVAPSRRIKKPVRKAPPRIQPQKTQPGKDVGGKLKIEELYGKDEPGKRSALRALRKSSDDVKKMKSINGLAGSMFGAGIDMALGQKPDKNLSRNLGNIFGSVIASAVDMELNNSFGDISKTIAMANGGVVPSREIGKSLSIGERIGSFISRALAVSIESSASKILQNLRNEMNLEGGVEGGAGGAGGAGGGGDGAGGYAEGEKNFVPSKEVYAYLISKGLSHNHAIGILANIQAESSFNAGAIGDNGTSGGLFQHHAERFSGMVAYAGKDWAKNWKRQVDYALREDAGKQYTNKQFNSPEEASAWFTLNFERPSNKELKAKERLGNIKNFGSDGSWKGAAGGSIEYVAPNKNINLKFMRGLSDTHKGADIAAPEGTPLRAVSDGEIIEAGVQPGGTGWGNYIVYKDDKGIYHLYGHLQNGYKKSGKIKKGDIIAKVGMTGRTTGPHLHWEIGTGWKGVITGRLDPMKRYSMNAPFFTAKKSDPPKTTQDKNKPSAIFDWEKASLAPSQSSSVASLNKSGILKEDTSTMIYNNNAVAILPIEVTA